MTTQIKINRDLTKWEILQMRDYLNGLFETDSHFSLTKQDETCIIEFQEN